MIILPAIDLVDKKAVRLLKGDYDKMTVYSDNPIEIAKDFKNKGAGYIHIVDLEGAKDATTPNISVVSQIAKETDLFVEVGGGIRNMETVEKYIDTGVSRVILGTSAVTDEEFLKKAVEKYGKKIAVGADIKDGFIAIKGWIEKSNVTVDEFFEKMQKIGVDNIICTDISKDGAMKGTNRQLYKELSEKYCVKISILKKSMKTDLFPNIWD
ncbi:MAG: 1-(5-phosphoribosyl)-5-((5-phosphoribosylamino)methylideneamino)imidazole-4-carboxamide isomerase [Clostridia bacterium]|nr:1-(5-phosphoribosyl)-5-((5-phosphoribosylamino)methylideneamino)imidazole-4-carboxamide isomerase [Clostridia bacterium]